VSDQESFISHLIELRTRLMRAGAAVLVLFVALFFYPGSGVIYDFLAAPLISVMGPDAKLIATGVVTPFMIPVKVTAVVAFMLALPVVLYQAWAFVAPGLYEHEKKLAAPLIIASTLLFFAGVAFCYYFVFGKVFAFIQGFAPKSISPMPDIEAYFNFVLTMFIAFGVTFEIPIVVILLVRMGIVSVAKLADARPYVIVGAFIVAAVVTPPDVISQFMLAVPMCILYEAGLFFARFVGTRAKEEAAKEESSTV
jgi:sec-independent protein translocase protein TatC